VENNRDHFVKTETEKFQGTWKQIAYERDGVSEPQDDERDWHPRTLFVGNSFVVTVADGSTPIRGTFAIGPASEPASIDYTDTFGADAGKTFLAIYYFEGDRLVFCAAASGQPRPTAFKTKQGEVLRVFVRESP
jgi:uncharacterized protein (TIGR03067 family)